MAKSEGKKSRKYGRNKAKCDRYRVRGKKGTATGNRVHRKKRPEEDIKHPFILNEPGYKHIPRIDRPHLSQEFKDLGDPMSQEVATFRLRAPYADRATATPRGTHKHRPHPRLKRRRVVIGL